MKILIKQAKKIREELRLTHLVIFGVDEEGIQHIATHGKTKHNAAEAANLGNELKTKLNWPKSLHNSKPLERICGHCDYSTDHISGSGSHFYSCSVEPKSIETEYERKACKYFEPKY